MASFCPGPGSKHGTFVNGEKVNAASLSNDSELAPATPFTPSFIPCVTTNTARIF
jgi:hypothetical protein